MVAYEQTGARKSGVPGSCLLRTPVSTAELTWLKASGMPGTEHLLELQPSDCFHMPNPSAV